MQNNFTSKIEAIPISGDKKKCDKTKEKAESMTSFSVLVIVTFFLRMFSSDTVISMIGNNPEVFSEQISE